MNKIVELNLVFNYVGFYLCIRIEIHLFVCALTKKVIKYRGHKQFRDIRYPKKRIWFLSNC